MLPSLRSQLDAVVARRSNFEAQARGMSEAQLRFRPAPGAWSISEVADHLMHAEKEAIKATTKDGVERRGQRRTLKQLLAAKGFRAVTWLNIRIKVPAKVAGLVTPGSTPDLNALWAQWRDAHDQLERYLETIGPGDVDYMAFRHPIMGPTRVDGILPFFTQHFDHHMKQVRRIRASPGFPR
ncbi:MAG TPA: DinB family protein [Gemmatimonadaceae bacterium]|nr:DinB family protein [Gemmatimonadaceae bacterium]